MGGTALEWVLKTVFYSHNDVTYFATGENKTTSHSLLLIHNTIFKWTSIDNPRTVPHSSMSNINSL